MALLPLPPLLKTRPPSFFFCMELFNSNFAIFLLFLASFLLFEFLLVKCNTLSQCLQGESSALLELKREFTSCELNTWQPGTDCCIWEGVTCNKLRRVIGLDLSNQSITGMINPSLFSLTSLQNLNFAYNWFDQTAIPDSGWDKLENLSSLNLSYAGFCSGRIPPSIGNLSQLVSLDLSANNFSGPVPFFSPPLELNGLPVLDAHICLKGKLCNLEMLDLSNNSLSGPIHSSVFTLRALRSLLLQQNQFSGQLGEFLNASPLLTNVDLSNNELQGQIPRSLFHISGLVFLSLASNNFSGAVELEFIKGLRNLSYLDLSSSGFSLSSWNIDNGYSSSSFPILSTLKLANCNLTKIPAFIMNQHRLYTLDLSNNRINGEMPSYLRSISKLNELTSFITSNISSYPYLTFFFLANNTLTGEIPPSICNLTELQVLDLSNNRLIGSIPQCLLEEGINLQVLHLRENQIHGAIPHRISPKCELRVINLRTNQLEGLLPKSISNCRSLVIMDLGNNNLKDTFPYWLGNMPSLRVLVLRSNKFYGLVVSHVGNHKMNYTFPMLHVLDISSNNFSGNLRKDLFNNFKSMMINTEVTTHDFAFNLAGRYFDLDVPTIMKKGQLMMLQKFWMIIRSLDFSNNHFDGEIPISIGQLISLQVLNLSQNNLTGTIPPQLGNLTKLESLDLSMNSLSGKIPQDLVSLYFLSYLNLSYNKLVGQVPIGGQFSTFPNTSFEGNNGLCWFPCTKSVPSVNNTVASPPGLGGTTPKRSYMIVLGILFGVGVGGGIATVVLVDVMYCDGRRKRSRRPVH